MTSTPVKHLGIINVDGAREKILRFILDNRDKKVFYFHGWSGLGASAVLKSIAEVLPSRRTTPELCFDRIIYIDCSEWKSRRALQRGIAKKLELDNSVMAILDKLDEEDDFRGVDESSRNEVLDVSKKINDTLSGSRFMVIFHSGGDDENEIDLCPLGVPSFVKFADNIIIWTYRRRILTIKEYEEHEPIRKLRYTHLLIYDRTHYLTSEQFYALLCKEAAVIGAGNRCMRGIDPMMVADCFMYKLFVHCGLRNHTKSDWAGLASNYLICDGILQEDIAHDISNALQQELSWECDDNVLAKLKEYFKLPFQVVKDDDMYKEGSYRWISITSRDTKLCGMQTVPAVVTSFFLAFQIIDHPPALPNGLFEHSNNLGVLILCCCAFNFASPPFLKCQSLRFLGLDSCIDDKTGEGDDHTEWACLHCLLVLDLCYTEWNEILSLAKMDLMTNLMELSIEGVWCWQYTSRLHWRLPNLQRFRIIKPTRGPEVSTDTSNPFLDDETKLESNFFLDKTKLEILDLSGNNEMKILPNSLSKASSLQVLVLDGCNGLENVVVHDGLPHSLKSFSFDGYGPAFHWAPTVELPLKHERPSTAEENKCASISKISLAGCTQLENLFVRGLPNLVELDLSGSAIKTLDFGTMVVEVPSLKRLFLLGCEHLRYINWSNNTDFKLDLLCIDTRAGTTDCSRPSLDRNKSFRLQVHAVLADARLVRSLESLLSERNNDVYLNILVTSSPMYGGSVQLEETYKKTKIGLHSNQVSLLPPSVAARRYSDVRSMISDAPMQVFPKPPVNNLDRHVEIAKESHGLDSSLYEADVVKLHAKSLHVHDVSVSGSMPIGSWDKLKQCRMESCPKLDEVFPSKSYDFGELKIFWASDLLMARWVIGMDNRVSEVSFGKLQHLHLRSCPRFQFVLPVWRSSFPCLETLHIIHCGDLKHVFVLDRKYPNKITTQGVSFPKLTTIHLHDLPVLRQIMCEEVKMVAPALKTIKIRGCWGLRRLPVVGSPSGSTKKPTVEIEEDVWDMLEWDGDHHPGHFHAPLCSRYRKKLPRVSLLR